MQNCFSIFHKCFQKIGRDSLNYIPWKMNSNSKRLFEQNYQTNIKKFGSIIKSDLKNPLQNEKHKKEGINKISKNNKNKISSLCNLDKNSNKIDLNETQKELEFKGMGNTFNQNKFKDIIAQGNNSFSLSNHYLKETQSSINRGKKANQKDLNKQKIYKILH